MPETNIIFKSTIPQQKKGTICIFQIRIGKEKWNEKKKIISEDQEEKKWNSEKKSSAIHKMEEVRPNLW